MIQIAEWTADHPQWNELLALVLALNQLRWLEASADWHLSSHVLVVLSENSDPYPK